MKAYRSMNAASALAILVAGGSFPAYAATLQTGDQADSQEAPPRPVPASQTAPASGTGATPAASPVISDDQAADIVVTGFRNSLSRALDLKRTQNGVTDSILAEDVGKFPDSNLAESMQRVPGVALQRGDGGEGRTITVRGLGPLFTRTRVNGMEGNSGTSGSDVQGSNGRSRGFDFSVFASELFENLTIRKTYSADTSEGSLGATVDLASPHPLDYKQDFVLAASAKALYNDLNKDASPRVAGLISKKFANGTFGVLLSGAYTERRTREEGYSPANILPANVDGGFCSPIGYSSQNPTTDTIKGTDALNCATGVPRTSTTAAYNAVVGANAFSPRLPRYFRSDQEYKRLGLTGSLQWSPDEHTVVSLDGLYSKYTAKRLDLFMGALSFGRGVGNNGKPDTSIVDAVVAPDKTVEYGLFNGVDVSSFSTIDNYTTTFKQATLSAKHTFNDWFELDGQVGYGKTVLNEPGRYDLRIDANNVNNFSFDFRNGGNIPSIGYGFNIADPSKYVFGPTLADGTVQGSFGGRKVYNDFDNRQYSLNGLFKVTPDFAFHVGGQYRQSKFTSLEQGRAAAISAFNPSLPAGTSLASLVSTVDGFGKGLRSGLPATWVYPDYDKFNAALGLGSNTGNFAFTGAETGTSLGGNYAINEKVTGAYLQAEFDAKSLGLPIRGNAGIRFVHTDQGSFGYVTVPTSVNANGFQPVTVDRSYNDWLGSVNLTADITRKLLLRFSAANVMARPDLGALSPSGGFNPTIRTVSVGNTTLDPVRASTIDLAAEWYFSPGSVLSVGYFYKNITSYIQTIQRLVPYSDTGLPASLLNGTQATTADLFTVTSLANTPGGPIKGVEFNYQQQLRFLPSFLSSTGFLLSYTHVNANINYILNASTGATTTQPLVGMSKNQLNATLYYEDKKFSIRGSANYRSSNVRAVPSIGTNSDYDIGAPTTFVDFSASYGITDQVRISLEGTNLTDQHTQYFVDSVRYNPLYDSHFGRTFTAGVAFRY